MTGPTLQAANRRHAQSAANVYSLEREMVPNVLLFCVIQAVHGRNLSDHVAETGAVSVLCPL